MYDNIIKYHWNLPCMHCINNVHCSSTRVKKMYNVTLLGTACTKQYAQGPKVQSNRREGPVLGILKEHLEHFHFQTNCNQVEMLWESPKMSQVAQLFLLCMLLFVMKPEWSPICLLRNLLHHAPKATATEALWRQARPPKPAANLPTHGANSWGTVQALRKTQL